MKRMEYINVLHILVYVLCLNQTGFSQCGINLCLTWRVSTNNLTLVCKTRSLIHKVLIYDPTGHLQADCLPPSPEVHCDHFYRNGIISLNPQTNETTYVVRGKIDKSLNGVWTCRHGIQYDVANVEVTIFESKENCTKPRRTTVEYNNSAPKNDCIKENLLWTSISFVSSTFIATILLTCSRFRTDPINAFVKKYVQQGDGKCCCLQEDIITKIRTILFWILTLVFFGAAAAEGFRNDNTCSNKYVFSVVGLFLGFVGKYFCFQRNANREHDAENRPERMEPNREHDTENRPERMEMIQIMFGESNEES